VNSNRATTTLYHGTTEVFSKFDPTKIGRRDSGNLGRGIYLSRDPTFAMRYAEDNAAKLGKAPVVLRVRAKLGKVADFYALIPEMRRALGITFPPVAHDTHRSEILRQWLMDQGYASAEAGSEIVVFDSRRLHIEGQEIVGTEKERLRDMMQHFQETGQVLKEADLHFYRKRAAAKNPSTQHERKAAAFTTALYHEMAQVCDDIERLDAFWSRCAPVIAAMVEARLRR
jgi:hypothetical protein